MGRRWQYEIPLSAAAAGASGAAGAALVIVANEAAASALAGLVDGQQIFVLSHRSIWTSNPASVAPIVPHERIARAGGGTLDRTSYSDPTWRTDITDIYIDPANATGIADDENRGIFAAPQVGNARQPLRSFQELYRRWQIFQIDAPVGTFFVTVHILSSEDPTVAQTDKLECRIVLGLDSFLNFVGDASATTTLLTAQLDGVGGFTAQNPFAGGGGTACQIKFDTFVWAPYVGKRIHFPATDSYAIILKDLGGGSARISQPQTTSYLALEISPTNVNPANGAAFVIEDPPLVNLGVWEPVPEGTVGGFYPQIGLVNLRIQDPTLGVENIAWPPPGSIVGTLTTILYYCVSERTMSQQRNIVGNASFALAGYVNDALGTGFGHWFGGAIMALSPNSYVAVTGSGSGDVGLYGVFNNYTYVQGVGVVFRGICESGQFSVWDAPVDASYNPNGDAIRLGTTSNVWSSVAGIDLKGPVWGNGSAGHGVYIAAAGQVSYQSLPNVVGGAGDFQLGDATSAWFFAPGTATYGPAVGPLACTWANLAAAQPGGFGGSAHEPGRNAHIVQAAST